MSINYSFFTHLAKSSRISGFTGYLIIIISLYFSMPFEAKGLYPLGDLQADAMSGVGEYKTFRGNQPAVLQAE
jgi:hypothetical protein